MNTTNHTSIPHLDGFLQPKPRQPRDIIPGKALIVKTTHLIEAQGDTYRFKQDFKDAGFRWDPALKRWFTGSCGFDVSKLDGVPGIEITDEVRAICATWQPGPNQN